MEMKINHYEMSALNGLPFIQRLIYLQGIRPFVDYQTSIVGIKRGISYQSLSEVLYVEPHQGIQSGSPSKDQLRRALKGLVKTGLIENYSTDKKLIFKCLLLDKNNFGQNKAAINPPQKAATNPHEKTPMNTGFSQVEASKAKIVELTKAAIPLKEDNNIYFCLLTHFEQFWAIYPLKCSKEKAWQLFQALNPSEALITQMLNALQNQILHKQQMTALGQWVPNWKNPANWLAQQCWNDVLPTEKTLQDNQHGKNKLNYRKQETRDPLWDLCKPDHDESKTELGNVIQFKKR